MGSSPRFWTSIDDRYRSEGSRLTKSLDKKPIEHLIFFSLSLSLSFSHFLYLDLNRPHFDTRGSHLVSQFLLWSSLSIRAIAKFRRFVFSLSLRSFDLLDIYLYLALTDHSFRDTFCLSHVDRSF